MKFNKLMIAMGMACGVMLTGCNDSEDSTPPTEPETQLQTLPLMAYSKPISDEPPTAYPISKPTI